MNIEWMPIDRLKPYANNPRNNEFAVDKVAMSIETFGFKQPIVVDPDHVIIVGHTRFLAAKQLKLQEIPVLVAKDLTPEQAKAYRLADNRTHDEARWERDKLAEEMGQLSELDLDLALTGFDVQELTALMAMADQVKEGEIALHDCPAPSTQPVSQRGDLWCLGRHRVLCGDSTKIASVMALMGDEKADMVFTDPPYNVNYRGRTADQLMLSNDALSEGDFEQLLHQAFATCARAIKPQASLYVCYAGAQRLVFEGALTANGFAIRTDLVWAKQHFAQNFGRYKFQHEPILYCHRKGERDAWYGDKRQTTLWHFNQPYANRAHPTMKPVALIEKALQNSSREGERVLDLFGGSGSTLIACEKTARIAYLMELDPRYVDAIIERWQQFTGQRAQLAGSSLSFNEKPRMIDSTEEKSR